MTDKTELKGWQPIETAPKDGSYVLVWQPDVLEPSQTVCSFDDDWWYCCDGKNPEIPLRGSEPTHWQPLPDAPNTRTQPKQSRRQRNESTKPIQGRNHC